MDIGTFDDASRLLGNLDMITDTALEAAVEAVSPPGIVVSGLCDAMRWVATEGTVHAITSISGVWTPRGRLLMFTATFVAGGTDVRIMEHIHVVPVHLLEYVCKDPRSATSGLITRWSLGHAPISPTRLRYLTLKQMYHRKEKTPSPDGDTARGMQNPKRDTHTAKAHLPNLPEHLRTTWDPLRV